MIPKRTWTAGPNNNKNEQATSVARSPFILLCIPPLQICVRSGWASASALVLKLYWTVLTGLGGSLVPCTLRPVPIASPN